MYPFLRLFIALLREWGKPKLHPDAVFTTYHRIMPWDIDIFGELNNGKTLTIMDLNRLPFGLRTGLSKAVRENKWGLTMAGVSVRFRRRVKMFDKVRITCRAAGKDERFVYLVQTMWLGDEAAHNALYRSTVYSKDGIVPADKLGAAMGHPDWDPKMPDWVKNWIEAEDTREWPPET
ncbi:MAG: acyl-CoA thioesterase [Pseudomonadota bacterium]